MWAPYRRVAAACLPEATVVCDKFRVVRIIGKALDGGRRRDRPPVPLGQRH